MMKVIGYVDPILETAGPRSRRDMWRAVPPMVIMARLTRLFPFLSPERRGPAVIAALTVVAIVTAAVLVLVL